MTSLLRLEGYLGGEQVDTKRRMFSADLVAVASLGLGRGTKLRES